MPIKGKRPRLKLVPSAGGNKYATDRVFHAASNKVTRIPQAGKEQRTGASSRRPAPEGLLKTSPTLLHAESAGTEHPAQGWLIDGADNQVAKGHLDQRESTPARGHGSAGARSRGSLEKTAKKEDKEAVRTGPRASGGDRRNPSPALTPTELQTTLTATEADQAPERESAPRAEGDRPER